MSALRMLVELIGYAIARTALTFLSFGKIYVEPFSASAPSSLRPCFRRDADGRIELRQEATARCGLGIGFLVLLASAAIVHGLSFRG